MEQSLPVISENVTDLLLKLYNITKDELLHIFASSPHITVLRVNQCHPNSHEAESLLKKYVNSLSTTHKYIVTKHDLLEDVLLLSSETCGTVQPCSEKEVIVDTSCGRAVLRGADVFAPGVLAAHPGMKRGDVVSVYADLEKKCRRGWVQKFDGVKYFLGNGVAKYSRQELFENNTSMTGVAIAMTCLLNQFPSFATLDSSMFFPQNLPSILVGYILRPEEDDMVLDMCAAPGGKTTHVASLLRNKGIVIAIDKTINKVNKLKETCSKLNISNVKCFSYDSTKLSVWKDALVETVLSDASPPYSEGTFDKIMLDPPCSGVGQRPQLSYVKSDKELHSYPTYQRKLLKQAITLLKPGGCLVYSTCTLLPQENEEQVGWVLKHFPQMKLEKQTPYFGRHGLDGYGLDESECSKVQRFDWCFSSKFVDLEILERSRSDTIGFFIAKFVKSK